MLESTLRRIERHLRRGGLLGIAQDGALLGKLTRIFVETVQTFYAERAAREGALGAKTGAVTVVQRTSSDLRLNPHLTWSLSTAPGTSRAASCAGKDSGT